MTNTTPRCPICGDRAVGITCGRTTCYAAVVNQRVIIEAEMTPEQEAKFDAFIDYMLRNKEDVEVEDGYWETPEGKAGIAAFEEFRERVKVLQERING